MDSIALIIAFALALQPARLACPAGRAPGGRFCNQGQRGGGGRNVFHGDPTDLDFWGRADPESEDKEENKIRLALLAMPKFSANVETANLIIQFGFKCLIAASVRFDDEVTALKEIGVHAAFNFFEEAGAGLAEAAYEKLESQMNALAQENKK